MRHLRKLIFLLTLASVSQARLASGQNPESPPPTDSIADQITKSGLSVDQIRARLRASGYPESLLDSYLNGDTTSRGRVQGDSLARAVRALGLSSPLADSTHLLSRDSTDTTRLSRRDTAQANERRSRVFGLDIFRRSSSRFEPALAGGVGPDYKVGPGDVLALIITGDVERAYSLDVSREGFVLVPQVGQVYVANLTMDQLYSLFATRLRQAYSGISRSPNASTKFYVTVARLHTNQIFVLGEVRYPGNYQVSSIGTLLTALYAAGGPSDNGTLRNVLVRRAGQVLTTVDVYDYLLRGDARNDPRLESGDIVFVGVHEGRVSVRGQIVRPAIYELKPGETLADLIQFAGGFTSEAAQQRIQVHRVLPSSERESGGRDRVVLDVLPSQFVGGTAPAFMLEPGDSVEVFGVASRERNRLVVDGNVWSPGVVAYTPGMRLSQALQRAGGTKPSTYLGEVLVSRLESDLSRRSLHVHLRAITGTPEPDIALAEDDSIQVFSQKDFLTPQTIGIAGAVRKPGRYAYQSDMTLRELLLMAGGASEGADLRSVEIARVPEDRPAGTLATTFRVPLDSSYVFGSNGDGNTSYIRSSGPSTAEVRLQAYDNVLVLRQPGWQLPSSVIVLGEVRYPGTYTLTRKDERLTDILQRAGGLTPDADPGAFLFSRGDGVGRVGINLPEVLRDARAKDNFVLVAGDSLVIRPYRAYVRVRGAVNSPTTVAYQKGEDLGYYIAAAGGAKKSGDPGRAYVTQPNGAVEASRSQGLLARSQPEPRAGSTVTVPEKDPNDKTDYPAIITTLGTVISSLTLLIAVFKR
jgi:polysaccharide export outer membrane protein